MIAHALGWESEIPPLSQHAMEFCRDAVMREAENDDDGSTSIGVLAAASSGRWGE